MSLPEAICVGVLLTIAISLVAIHVVLYRMVLAMEAYVQDARMRLDSYNTAVEDGVVEAETLPLGLHHPTEDLKNEYLVEKVPLLPVDKRSPYDDWNWGIKDDDVDGE